MYKDIQQKVNGFFTKLPFKKLWAERRQLSNIGSQAVKKSALLREKNLQNGKIYLTKVRPAAQGYQTQHHKLKNKSPDFPR